MVQDAIQAGAKGGFIGRNVFEHDEIAHMRRAIARVVFKGVSAEEAYRR